MNRTAINVAAFMVAFFLTIYAGHASAEAWIMPTTSQYTGVLSCSKEEACNNAIGAVIRDQVQCPQPTGWTTRTQTYHLQWSNNACQLSWTVSSACGGSSGSTVTSNPTYKPNEDCPLTCPQGEEDVDGQCVAVCPDGQERNEQGECRRTQEECERLADEEVQRVWSGERPVGSQYCVQGCVATVYAAGNGESVGYYSDGVNGPQTCDGNEEDGPLATPTPSPSPTPGPTPTASPTPTPSGTPEPSPSPGGGGTGGEGEGEGEGEGGICDDGECAFSDSPFGDVPGSDELYEAEYEGGVMGVFQDKWPAIQQTAFVQGISQLAPDFGGGGCPTFTFDISIPGMGNLGTHQIDNLCPILQVVGIFFLLTASFTARALIFGG